MDSLSTLREDQPAGQTPRERAGDPTSESSTDPVTLDEPFHWAPPDLSRGSKWHRDRVASLREASKTCEDPEKAFRDGLRILDIHRNNYNQEGPDPKCLQLIWWEFPQEHWEALREGSPMNFLQDPPPGIQDNSPMTPEQCRVAGEFVDELKELGVLRPPEEGEVVLSSAPLFCVPKEGQPGEWRVIADMLRGGQNDCIGSDPVFLPRVTHILDSLYEGGYSAVVDASKFFYQFPTFPPDRVHLGIKHPITGEVLVYHGLPMGSRNSPSLAGRYGTSFLRKLREDTPIFQGEVSASCFWTAFGHPDDYQPGLGYGYVLKSSPTTAAAWAKAFVDDFLIHGQTYQDCARALTAFLDQALKCGLLCHPKKLVAPTQRVKYCGVILDTSGTPTCHIPDTKKERASAMIRHLLSNPSREWSRLALSVVGGVLESLAECTPRRIGHTYLKSLHYQIHPPGTGTGLDPYLSSTQLSSRTLKELTWWALHLEVGQG
jgi:hypothetical protein